MLDGIRAGFGGDARGFLSNGVCGDFDTSGVRFVDDGFHFVESYIRGRAVHDDLDAIGAIVEGLTHGLARAFRPVNGHVLLFNNGLRLRRQWPKLPALRGERARRGHDSWS